MSTRPPEPSFPEDSDALPPPAPPGVPTLDLVPLQSPAAPALPSVPGYEVLGRQGEGGMGVVYRALDLRLKRMVALKVIKAGLEVPAEALARFQAEAEALARLSHPHLVQVYELGSWQPPAGPPLPYLALEFVAGGSLDDRLRQGPVDPRDAAGLVEVLARAIGAAHAKGIVHRDLKPANVLLSPPVEGSSGNSAFGFPKVSDFGLVKCLDAGQSHTATGQVVGTPAYMAPEQAEGRSDVGAAADVYALGAILYRLLAGRVPFEANSTVALLYQVVHQPPRPIRELRPEVPAGLEEVCLRCLEKQPASRYPSAGELADALHRWLEAHAGQGPTTDWVRAPAEETGPQQPVPAPVRLRRRWLLAATAALVLGVGGLVAWWMWGGIIGRLGPAAPLKGSIDVLISRPGKSRPMRLNDPQARPLRLGDTVRIAVELNRPAYLYVLWIDAEGKVGPVYPWVEGDWNRRGTEKPNQKLLLPETHFGESARNRDEGPPNYPMKTGPAGMETLLLGVRATPLPVNVDLEAVLAGLGTQARDNADELREVAWFQNGDLVWDEKDRAPNLGGTKGSGNPMLRLQYVLGERLGEHFEFTRAVTFGYQGGKE
jgi:hypothetical protein